VAGVLQGLTVLELGGVGPVPFCGMMLADHGATVIQLRRVGSRRNGVADPELSPLNRSRLVLEVDLKDARGRDVVRRLLPRCDALIEGFRPGVLERLGLAPRELIEEVNPRLVVGRMTGWGQAGPLAQAAGHDINYLALSGTLDMLGRRDDQPTPPANLLGDFGGGGMLLAFGVVAALLRARLTGRGQVVDCAIVDGAALLASMLWGFRAQGRWQWRRGTNFLDGGAHYYDTYRCADGRHLAVGALEPAFYEAFLARLGVDHSLLRESRTDPARWPQLRALIADVIATRTRDEWTAIFADSDACVTPVLGPEEAAGHPHNVSRGTFMYVGDRLQPAPAPRFSVDAPRPAHGPVSGDGDIEGILRDAGLTDAEIARLRCEGALG
jgi:alpha-methylacyl-CoA racemase